MSLKIGEEPPLLRRATGREYYFPEVSDEDWSSWQWQTKNRIKTIDAINNLIGIPEPENSLLKQLSSGFDLHIGIPPYYLSLIDNERVPYDPVYLQAVPSSLEFGTIGCPDPLNEDEQTPVDGIVHRYPDRCLFLSTNICGMMCRFCSRKRLWKKGYLPKSKKQLDQMIEYVRKSSQIRDVILSGGDPLSLPERTLEYVLSELRNIPHVEIIRIGTRYPVVMPQRITQSLVDMISKYGPIWVNTHFNAAQEITPEAKEACQRFLRAGMPVNNQSVLLKGVNDSVQDMSALCKKLLTIGVKPFYMYRNDDTQGTEHFTTTIQCGVDIIGGMQGFTSGLAIPTFVVDVLGGGGKIPIQPNHIQESTADSITLVNYEGKTYKYKV